MKKLILLCCVSLCVIFVSCRHDDGNISIQYNDDDNSYSMNAWFGKDKTRRVERYMNETIGIENDIQFHHTRMNSKLTLDDGSKFYIKKSPGHIIIKMNRDETSDHTYNIMKDMCMGLKDIVVK